MPERQSGRNLVDVALKLALEVGSLILGNSIFACEAVEHSGNFYQSGSSLGLVGHLAEIANGVTGSLCIVTVTETTRLSLTNSLKR